MADHAHLQANGGGRAAAPPSRSPSSAAQTSTSHSAGSSSHGVHGFGPPGTRTSASANIHGMVHGGASIPGGSASLPSNSRDVASGGVGAEYGPYSHIRTGNGVGAGIQGAQGKAQYAQQQQQNTGLYSTNSSGSASGSSNHSGAGLLPVHSDKSNNYNNNISNDNAAGVGPRFKGPAAYSHSGLSGSLGTESFSNEKRDSSYSSVYSEASGRYAVATPAGALLWDSKDAEPDDYLHNPDPKRDAKLDRHCTIFSMRGILNVAALLVLVCGLLALFAGYPIIAHFVHKSAGTLGGFGLGGTNGTGQVAFLNGLRNLIDEDTKEADKTWTSGTNGNKYQLVFSDEFQQEGRTFWPGDDPFWEAVDIWYGATGDYEWYSPEAINTTGGALQIVMRQKETHNLNFQSGMLQSWNKFCFQGGYIEMAVQLPGRQDTRGFWPGLWTMGNLGRPGYLGSTEGMWPYSYDSCDYGTLPNQTNPQGTGPPRVLNAQGPYSKNYDNKLSYLPGQRASACTCAGEDHPGPSHDVGRASPEIDILEAQNTHSIGEASQSLQTAPFDPDYAWDETAATFYGTAKANSYTGSVYQEAVSGISNIPADSYHDAAGARFVTYGFEYQPDWNKDGSGWITWYMDGKKTWTVTSDSVPARTDINIARRLIPTEPMSIIINLGISSGFQAVHWDELDFPGIMLVDYVRVYQLAGTESKTSCDPPDHPTAQYIEDHPDVYTNPNYTIWPRDRYPWPKNRLVNVC